MAMQLKWTYQSVYWTKFDVPSENIHRPGLEQFLRTEMNDIHPMFLKIVAFDIRAFLFYPTTKPHDLHQPRVGSADRWNFNSKEFDDFDDIPDEEATLEIGEFVVGVLNNLDPGEAILSQVTMMSSESTFGNDYAVITVISPEGTL